MTRIYLILFLLMWKCSNMTPTGSPDFGANQSTNPTAPSFDTGEDTTRLLMGGGAFARSGRWIFATGFEDTTNSIYKWGGGATKDSSISFQGDSSLKLSPNTAVNAQTGFTKYFVLPGTRYGIECMFSKGNSTAYNSEFSLSILTQGRGVGKNERYTANLILVNTTTPTNILYWDVNGTRTELFDLTNYINSINTPHLWHNLKMVFDLENNKGVRVFFDDLKIDTSSLSGYLTTGFDSPLITTTYALKNITLGGLPVFYLDNCIITADEP